MKDKEPIDWVIMPCSVPPELLQKTDEYGEIHKKTRSCVIRMALYSMFGDVVNFQREMEKHK